MAPTLRSICLAALLAPVSAMKNRLAADACTCQVWKDAYAQYGSSVSLNPADEELASVLKRFSSNACMNRDYGRLKKAGQYCVVSASCQQLNGGSALTEQISMKICTEADEPLADKTAVELSTLAKKDNLNLDLVLKYSYALHPTWKYSEALVADEMRLGYIGDSGIRTVINPTPGDLQMLVVDGSSVYKMIPNFKVQLKASMANKMMKTDLYQDGGNFWFLVCHRGCPADDHTVEAFLASR